MFYETFDIINIQEFGGRYSVTVTFNDEPTKQYVFDISEEKFETDKEAIGEEILRQLRRA